MAEGAADRSAIGAHEAAQQDHVVGRVLRQAARNLDAVGHDGEVAAILEKFGEVVNGGAGVEEQGVAIFDEFGRPAGDAALGFFRDARARRKGRAGQALPVDNRAAAHPRQPARFRQRPQVIADGALGHIQRPRDFRDADAGLFADNVEEALLPFKSRQGDRLVVRIVETCRIAFET